jgi:phosphoribosylformylglycinamidine (FGAM) synthase-like amidotransferase family enzyme
MPHPERASEVLLGCDDGLLIFRSLIHWIEQHGAAAAA